MHRLLQAIIPIFLLSLTFVGCSSSDEDEGSLTDGIVVELDVGRKILLKETETYPDSIVLANKVMVPCIPVSEHELPSWLIDGAIKASRNLSTYIYQGEKKDGGEIVYIVRPVPDAYLRHVFDWSGAGKSYEVDPQQPEREFFESTQNWRCIFIINVFRLD